jgi:hypothetical protein
MYTYKPNYQYNPQKEYRVGRWEAKVASKQNTRSTPDVKDRSLLFARSLRTLYYFHFMINGKIYLLENLNPKNYIKSIDIIYISNNEQNMNLLGGA